MNTTGAIKSVAISFPSRGSVVTLEVTAAPEVVERYIGQNLDISINKHQERRSLQANRFLWACIQDIANATCEDKDAVYYDLLRHYGQYTLLSVPTEAVGKLKLEWRETEVVGARIVNGVHMSDVICYFGSHTYTAQEFNRLLEGVKDTMRNLGIEPPPDERMRAVIAELERTECRAS